MLETEEDAAKRPSTAARCRRGLRQVGDIESRGVEGHELTAMKRGPPQLTGERALAYDPVSAAVGLGRRRSPSARPRGRHPLRVPARGAITGLSAGPASRGVVDLDQIPRGNVNPFRATLTVSKMRRSSPRSRRSVDADGEPLPQDRRRGLSREAFAQIVRVDLVFKPDRHMRLEYTVRVRDVRGLMHELLDAAATDAPDELAVFMPMVYVPPAPP